MPQGAKLDTPKGFTFKDHLKSGDVIDCREGIIYFGQSSLSIDLREAKRWDRRISTFHTDLKNTDIKNSWLKVCQKVIIRAREMTPEALPFVFPLFGVIHGGFNRKNGLYARLQKTIASDPFLTGLASVAEGKVPALIKAAQKTDIGGFACMLGVLVGLGPGLTPSGDDFITGFIAGLFCTSGNDPARLHFLKALKDKCRVIFNGTNEISRVFLSQAVHGHFCESLVCLVKHMAINKSVFSLNSAVDAALSMGSTSGIVTTAGLLTGLIPWGYYETEERGARVNHFKANS